MDKPIVLFLVDTLNTGGAERSLLDITSNFKKFKPVVCHIYQGSFLKNEFLQRGIEVVSLDIPPPYHWRLARKSVETVVRRIQPALIHSTLFKSDVISRIVAPPLGIPLINSLVNNSYHPSRFKGSGLVMNLKLKSVQLLDAVTARKVDLFISNSEAIKKSNAQALHLPLKKIKVIYRGRNVDAFGGTPDSAAQLKEELQIPSHANVLLNVSRIIHRKGQLEMIRAFGRILSDFPDTFLVIAGDGPYKSALEAEVVKMKLQNSVFLLGNRTDIPQLLSAATCFIFPSHYEGLPGVLIEAMFARLPIVASRIPENQECIDDENAYFFETGNEGAMMSAMASALNSKSERLERASRAYDRAIKKFEIRQIATEYESCYDSIVKLK